jgi:hypothetical protein
MLKQKKREIASSRKTLRKLTNPTPVPKPIFQE